MGGIKSKIFSDTSLDNTEVEINITQSNKKQAALSSSDFEKPKLFRNSTNSTDYAQKNSNNFDFYFVGDEEPDMSTRAHNKSMRESIRGTLSSSSASKSVPSFTAHTFTKINHNLKQETSQIPNLTEEEYNQIQQKKLRDHSLFDSKCSEFNKGT